MRGWVKSLTVSVEFRSDTPGSLRGAVELRGYLAELVPGRRRSRDRKAYVAQFREGPTVRAGDRAVSRIKAATQEGLGDLPYHNELTVFQFDRSRPAAYGHVLQVHRGVLDELPVLLLPKSRRIRHDLVCVEFVDGSMEMELIPCDQDGRQIARSEIVDLRSVDPKMMATYMTEAGVLGTPIARIEWL